MRSLFIVQVILILPCSSWLMICTNTTSEFGAIILTPCCSRWVERVRVLIVYAISYIPTKTLVGRLTLLPAILAGCPFHLGALWLIWCLTTRGISDWVMSLTVSKSLLRPLKSISSLLPPLVGPNICIVLAISLVEHGEIRGTFIAELVHQDGDCSLVFTVRYRELLYNELCYKVWILSCEQYLGTIGIEGEGYSVGAVDKVQASRTGSNHSPSLIQTFNDPPYSYLKWRYQASKTHTKG